MCGLAVPVLPVLPVLAAADLAALPQGLARSSLSGADLAGALELSEEAGWNQTGGDWTFMIGRGPGWACREATGEIVATALTLPYPDRFGWVGMVLVTARWRRRGIAADLLRLCVKSLRDLDLTPGLDATSAGREVYLGLGFCDLYPLTRYCRESAGGAPHRVSVGAVAARRLVVADLPAVAANDARAFGADRSALLEALIARAPARAMVTADGQAHCLARDGRLAMQLGPVVAPDCDHAIAVAAKALAGVGGAVLIDVPDHQVDFQCWLEDAGFRPQRHFMRMAHGRSEPFDVPARIFAIAGPELG